MIESLDMNVLLDGYGKRRQQKQNPQGKTGSDFTLYEKPQAQKTAPEKGIIPTQEEGDYGDEFINSFWEEFNKDEGGYVSLKQYEKPEDKKPENNAPKSNSYAEEKRSMDIDDIWANRFGVDQSVIDKINTEAEEKRGKDIFTESVESGVWNIGADLIGGADVILGREGGMLSRANDYMQKKADEKYADAMAAAKRTGKGKLAENSAEAIISLTETVPEIILAMATGGTSTMTSAAGKGGKLLSGFKNVMKEAVKSPVFWYNFETGLNQEYEKAIKNGATDSEAKTAAMLPAAINAVIETKDGKARLSNFFGTKEGKGKYALDWFESSAREGLGEFSQDAVSEITQEMMYGEGGNKVNLSDVREKLLIDMVVSGALNLPYTMNKAIAEGFDAEYVLKIVQDMLKKEDIGDKINLKYNK